MIIICVTLNKRQGQYNYLCCINMSEAVIVPSVIIMTWTVSEESLSRERQTRVFYVKICKNFATMDPYDEALEKWLP